MGASASALRPSAIPLVFGPTVKVSPAPLTESIVPLVAVKSAAVTVVVSSTSSATSSKTIGIEFVGSPCSGPSASVTVGATRSMTIVTTNNEAEALLRAGDTTLGGRIPVNPSGGLACFGEAVPAQAIAQVCELTWQLRGQAQGRQVEGARVGAVEGDDLLEGPGVGGLARQGLDARAELGPAQLAPQLLGGLPGRVEGVARGDGGAQVLQAPGGEQVPERRLLGRARLQAVEVRGLGPARIEPLQAGDLRLHPGGLLLRGVVAQRALVDHAGDAGGLGIDHDGRRARAIAVDDPGTLGLGRWARRLTRPLACSLGEGRRGRAEDERGEERQDPGDHDLRHDG